MIPLLLLLVITGDLNIGADGAMAFMGAATLGATLAVLLLVTPDFLPCNLRPQYCS